MNVASELKTRAAEIENRLYSLVPDIKGGQQRVLDAMRYSLEVAVSVCVLCFLLSSTDLPGAETGQLQSIWPVPLR